MAFSEVPTRFELVIKVLQTFALPLGYGTTYASDDQSEDLTVTPTGIEPVLPP